MKKLIKHLTSRKAIEYRIGKIVLTAALSWIFFGHPFKSLEFALALAGVVMIWYAIHEWRYE